MTAQLELIDARDTRVEPIWRALEAVARPTYFLTWGWIENWLASLPVDEIPQLAVITDAGAIAAGCFLGRRRLLRHGWTLASVLALIPRDWDEVFLPAIESGMIPVDDGGEFRVHVDRDMPAPFVDLARVRAAGDYVGLLGQSTRSQIRRARRGVGPCSLEVAEDAEQALAIFDELVELHAASWRERGQPGAFADPWFVQFHRRLISRRFAVGEIQLVRLRAGGATIGCLYNLIAYGQVLFYQSGLAPCADPKIKPGYLCHAAAIEHAAAAGHATYDLGGGGSRYKTALSTDAKRLVWVRIQRPLARFAIEDRVRGWKRALESRIRSTPHAPRAAPRVGGEASEIRAHGQRPGTRLGQVASQLPGRTRASGLDVRDR
jgi:hypothetical protein